MSLQRVCIYAGAVLLATGFPSVNAQSRLDSGEILSEEIRPTEQVGAKLLALHSFLVDRPIEVDRDRMIASVRLPPPVGLMRISLEAKDRSDKGYALRAQIECAAPGNCERIWALEKLRSIGLTVGDLWFAARVKEKNLTDSVFVPACFCKASTLTTREAVVFSLIPSRALNIRYSIYSDVGELLDTSLISNQPAGLPVVIRVAPHGIGQSRLKLVVNYIAASGGGAERFSDSFYFYQM
jgi:hypothetical protein